MTAVAGGIATVAQLPPTAWEAARIRFPPRLVTADWSATESGRAEVWQRLTRAPFVLDNESSQKRRKRGLMLLLDWLEDQPGRTWQDRWLVSGADAAGAGWRQVSTRWLHAHGELATWQQDVLSTALVMVICADLVRPSLSWLVSGATGKGTLARNMARSRDPQGFLRLQASCEADPHVRTLTASHTLHRTAEIVAAKGGTVADITIGDILELLDTEAGILTAATGDTAVFYRKLHEIGILGPDAPTTLRQIRSSGQRTPEELIDRYQLACRPIRDLLVDYLRERQPTLDYASVKSLACFLGMLFWQDLERHHPGIDTLHLPADVANGWKQRLRTKPKTITAKTGEKTQTQVPRLNYWECLIPVRAFYLDLAQWALEDPSRWGPWVAPCPIREHGHHQHRPDRAVVGSQ